jgi:hypothetical protein
MMRMLLGFNHHLKSAGIQEIPDQHAGRIAKCLVGCGVSATHDRIVHDVIVQQRRRVDEFDHRSQVETLLAVETQGAAGQQQQGRTQALAAGRNDVAGNAAHQRHAGVQAPRDHGVHLRASPGR